MLSSLMISLIVSVCGQNMRCHIWFNQCLRKEIIMMSTDADAIKNCKEKAKVVRF